MMVTLNAGGSGEGTPTSASGNTSLTSRSMVAKGHPLHRRRRVGKGNIAGFGGGYKGANVSADPATSSTGSPTQSASGSNPSSADPANAGGGDGGGSSDNSTMQTSISSKIGPSSAPSAGPTAGSGNQPQHAAEAITAPEKTLHSSRMAVLCCQNAIRMGAKTQLGLCPPGRPRRGLQAALRQRTRASTGQAASINSSRRLSVGTSDPSGYYTLEKMVGTQSLEDYEDQEEDYLLGTNTFDVESDEEASSGDEDEISNIDALLNPDASPHLDDESKYVNLQEPLFTPIGVENSLSNPNGAPMGGMGSNSSGKLPFNRRKIRYFDGITAQERQAARAYLRQEATKNRQRSALLLSRHLKRMQKQERIRRRREKGETVNEPMDDEETENEKTVLHGGVSQFNHPMTSSMSAALILESLSLNPAESIEGMAKCYDGIVSAGVALLDNQVNDPTSPVEREEEKDKPRASRAEVLAALAPLLITSLEQPSGDALLLLAKVRRMCGTPRYQRRFVQRIAPCLVRPKNAAMWCLRHQHDMEPIVAAVELILDSAHEIFSKGWYEKGRLYLADSKRAETLNSAAAQLRNLSSEQNSEGLSLGLNNQHHGMRRYTMSGSAQKDHKAGNAPLAEWEVMAVDREIRLSISKIMTSDWNRVTLNTVKDSDSVRSYRRSVTSKRPGVLPQSSSGEASPRAMISPRSPGRPLNTKTLVSSPPPKDVSSQASTIETEYESGLPPQSPSPAERPTSPDSALVQKSDAAMAMSPPESRQQSQDESDAKSQTGQTMPKMTPPRSPKSPVRDSMEQAPAQAKTSVTSSAPFTPLSPRRNKVLSPPSSQNTKEQSEPSSNASKEGSGIPFTPSLASGPAAPLSPSSLGTSSTSELVSYRPSSGSVISSGSGASQTAHYRTLTSTASERKRTVAACRALRAQITRFEDAFIQMHGRPPKGAAERAPLATTYSQYREWKRAIRADAACRIQALFRGARARWLLMKSDNAKLRRIVSGKAGRADFSGDPRGIGPSSNQENLLSQIGIPVEIGESTAERAAPLKPSYAKSSTSSPSPSGGSYGGQPSNQQSLAPQWASQVVRRRAGGTPDRTSDGFPTTFTPKPHASPMPSGNSGASDITTMSLAELQAKKRDLKQQLKQYDMSFARKHGRMPVKAEKEPIRHLYENYNALKSQIAALELENARQPQAPPAQQLSAAPAQAPPANRPFMNAPPTPPDSSDSDRSLDSPGHPGFMASGSRGKRKHLKSPPMASSPAPPAGPSQDLAALKAEKGQLHQMLRSYEKDFFKEHRRQVSSFADIEPVARQYRRYKEIKRAIAALQQSGER